MLSELRDILDIRKIRNECREYMTEDQSYISLWRQLKWFITQFLKYRENYPVLTVVREKKKRKAVAYILVTLRNNIPYLSMAVLKSHQNQGLGTHTLKEVLSLPWTEPVLYLKVFKKNIPAIKVYKKCGFKTVRILKHILLMKYEKKTL